MQQTETVTLVYGHDRVEPRLQIQKILARENSAVTMQVRILTALCAAYKNSNSGWTTMNDSTGRTADDAYALTLHGRQPCNI